MVLKINFYQNNSLINNIIEDRAMSKNLSLRLNLLLDISNQLSEVLETFNFVASWFLNISRGIKWY